VRIEGFPTDEQRPQPSEGFRPLAHSGLDFAMQGITTITEVLRVAGNLEDLPSYVRAAAAA